MELGLMRRVRKLKDDNWLAIYKCMLLRGKNITETEEIQWK